jgi:hypothetical protein
MKSVFAFAASVSVVAALACLAPLIPACSSSSTSGLAADAPYPPVTQCDSSKCAPGNQCLSLDGDLKCRKPCTSNTDPTNGCPTDYVCAGANEPTVLPATGCTKLAVANSKKQCDGQQALSGTRLTGYTCAGGAVPLKGCVDADGQGINFCCNDEPAQTLTQPVCEKMFNPVPAVAKGQWGATCDPMKGIYSNADCDFNNGFFCHGTAPTDATSYCTRYNCTADRECAGTFTCATINVGPNVSTAERTYHQTTTACLRRDYGASCTADVDCPPLAGRTQHCAFDDNNAGFCTPECDATTNCDYDAVCLDPTSSGTKICYPIAGVIVGNASLCSPCRDDSDCGADGLCLRGQYTQERFCAKKSATTCTANANGCPPSMKAGAQIACAVADPDAGASPVDNYCYGLYDIGFPDQGQQAMDLGCYTPARK